MAIIKKFIGDKKFYSSLFVLLVPIVIQLGITNFVALLDNIMVGTLGTAELNSVAIVNQLFFVFNLAIFGGISGASIFGAQFYGKGDMQGMCHTLRVKLYFIIFALVVSILVFLNFAPNLISLFLSKENNTREMLATTMEYATGYIKIAVWGLVPFAISQAYSSTLRETGDTVAPMRASVIAVLLNLVGNYILIFGKFGMPALGIEGAAISTIFARWIEALYMVIYAHRSTERYSFFGEVFKSFHVPKALLKRIAIVAAPLLCNEILYSLAGTFVTQNYASRGLVVMAAASINNTSWQLFCVIMFALGSAVSIVVGQHLGANEIEKAKEDANRLLFTTFVIQIFIGALIVFSSAYVPLLYNTEPEVRELASQMMCVAGLVLPFLSLSHSSYFVFRAGGKTVTTFMFDCGYSILVLVPVSFVLCRLTSLPVLQCFILVQLSEACKCLIAIALYRTGFWAKNVVGTEK